MKDSWFLSSSSRESSSISESAPSCSSISFSLTSTLDKRAKFETIFSKIFFWLHTWQNLKEHFRKYFLTTYLAIRRSDQGRHSHVLRFKYMKSEEIHCVRLWNVRDTDFRVYIIIEIKYFEGNFTCRFFIFAVFFITCLLASLFRLWEHQGLV